MHTLFMTLTSGVDWFAAWEPLKDVSYLATSLLPFSGSLVIL